MIQEIQNLLAAYHTWLKDKTALRQIDQWVEITTPYLDRHNDLLNDSDHSVSQSVVDALLSYDVQPVSWSERESVREELAA